MFHIAAIDTKGNTNRLVQMDGTPMTWHSREDAEKQIECLKRTVWGQATEPKNFKWVIEAA